MRQWILGLVLILAFKLSVKQETPFFCLSTTRSPARVPFFISRWPVAKNIVLKEIFVRLTDQRSVTGIIHCKAKPWCRKEKKLTRLTIMPLLLTRRGWPGNHRLKSAFLKQQEERLRFHNIAWNFYHVVFLRPNRCTTGSTRVNS